MPPLPPPPPRLHFPRSGSVAFRLDSPSSKLFRPDASDRTTSTSSSPPLLPFFEKEKKNFREFRNIFSPPLFLTDRRRKGRGGAGARQIQNSSKFWKSPLLPVPSIPLDTSLRLSNNSIESHSREGGGGRGERRFRIPPDPLRSNFNLLRERERGKEREGREVRFLCRRAPIIPLFCPVRGRRSGRVTLPLTQ